MAKRKQKRPAIPKSSRRNPQAASDAMYETFHGTPPTGYKQYEVKLHHHEWLANLGRLLYLVVIRNDGETIKMKPKDTIQLSTTEDGGQLYFLGGNQEVKLSDWKLEETLPKDFVVIGPCVEIAYHTSKGFHQFQPTDYYHFFGEERGGVPPMLEYDVRSKRLYLSGGTYQVKPEGIVN